MLKANHSQDMLSQIENLAAGYKQFYEEQEESGPEEGEEESMEDEEAIEQSDDDLDFIPTKKKKHTL